MTLDDARCTATLLWRGRPADADGRHMIDRIADAIRLAVLDERRACADIVLRGGDGVNRLETAIAHGPNAAIAEAILSRE